MTSANLTRDETAARSASISVQRVRVELAASIDERREFRSQVPMVEHDGSEFVTTWTSTTVPDPEKTGEIQLYIIRIAKRHPTGEHPVQLSHLRQQQRI